MKIQYICPHCGKEMEKNIIDRVINRERCICGNLMNIKAEIYAPDNFHERGKGGK